MKKQGSQSGFGITELLVAMGILGIIVVGFSQFMTSSQVSLKQMDLKGETQNLQTLMRLSLTKSEQCKQALGLADTLTASKVKETYSNMTGTGSQKISLNEITLVGKTYRVGESDKNFTVTEINLLIEKKAASDFPATGTSFIAKLQIAAKPVNASVRQYGHNSEATLLIDFKTQGVLATSQVWAESCYSESLMDPEKTCADLGGRWLRGPDAGKNGTSDPSSFAGDPDYARHHIPSPRCELSGDIQLRQNEAPVGIPVRGGMNTEGERVEECYYSQSGFVRTYLCPSGSGNRAGHRCVFDENAQQWQRRYFITGGAMTALRSTDLRCDKGVKVSPRSPTSELLTFSDDLGVAYSISSVTDEQYWDRLSSVESCVLDPQNDKPVKCENPTNPEGALRGAARTCAYVKNSLPLGTASVLGSFDPVLSTTSTFAGGWVYVHPSHTGALSYTGTSTRLRNPRGQPCVSVIVNTSNFNDPGLSGPDFSPPTSVLADAPDRVKQCLVQATDKINNATKRQIVYTCDNSALPPWSSGGYNEWLGSIIYDHDDDGCAHTSNCKNGQTNGMGGTFSWVDHPDYDATDNPKPIGTKGQGVPLLQKGSCWYFDRVRLSTFANGTIVPKAQLAASTSIVVASASLLNWNRTWMYTGWVWMNGTLPDSKFQHKAGADATLQDKGMLTPVTQIPGIPCSGGVRISN